MTPVKSKGRLMILALAIVLVTGAGFGSPQKTGIAVKKPVFGGACMVCPWGALGLVVKDAMAPYGYDVQICHNCANANAPRLVAAAAMPPALVDIAGIPRSQALDVPIHPGAERYYRERGYIK